MTDRELILEVCHTLLNRALHREQQHDPNDEGDPSLEEL